MDGYRWKVLRMGAPRVQMSGTRDGRDASRVQEDGTRDGCTYREHVDGTRDGRT
jgi:hypothetical protein